MAHTHEVYSIDGKTEAELAELFGMEWDAENSIASYGTMLEKDRCGLYIFKNSNVYNLAATFAGGKNTTSVFKIESTYKYLHIIKNDKMEAYGFGMTDGSISKFAFIKCKVADIGTPNTKKDCILLLASTAGGLYITGEPNRLSSGCNQLNNGIQSASYTNTADGKVVLVNLYHIKDDAAFSLDGLFTPIAYPNVNFSRIINESFSLEGKNYHAVRSYPNGSVPTIVFEL